MYVYNIDGKTIREIELSPALFNIEENTHVMHEVLVAELAGARQGTASTKSRGMVRGGGRKPWRQKGTGAARQGSIRSPQWVGGGVVHGPKLGEVYEKKVNKKVRALALKSALTVKAKAQHIMVLADYDISTPKTKIVKSFLDKFKLKKTLFLLSDIFNDGCEKLYYSARNIKDTTVIDTRDLAVYWILKYDNIVITEDALVRLEEMLA